jgi:acetyl/propionyl-CoA carboxylase alpha subunit
VEHPVTEAVTGLDLVRLQLLVAEGMPLPDEVHEAVTDGPLGHAIEARIYAEDPAQHWLPSTGTLHRFEIPDAGAGIRVDSGVETGDVVSPHYDPMLAKVIVHSTVREEAAATLSDALARARIHGVTTNRNLLVRTLRHPEFLAGATDTGFLERHGVAELATPLVDDAAVGRHALAAALTGEAGRRARAVAQTTIPSGYRNNPFAPQRSSYDADGRSLEVGYRFDRSGRQLDLVELDGVPLDVDGCTVTPDAASITVDGVTRHYRVDRVGSTIYVDGPDGSSTLTGHVRFPLASEQVAPGSALAPMPGGVVRVAVAAGDTVEAGQLLVVLEAMKMEHAVHASAAGVVTEVDVTEGDQVETGRTLVVVEAAPTAEDGDHP